MVRMKTPADYDLPSSHTDWREHQLESIEWCEAQTGAAIVEAPTGSGKTSYAKAVSQSRSVVALVRTKSLQAGNYRDTYGAEILFGRGNYDCTHPDNLGATCADCLYEESMHRCPYSNRCKYLLAKAKCKASPFVALNYPYWMTSKSWRDDPPQALLLDECHNLEAIITDWCGCTITEKDRVEWFLPDFPRISGRRPNAMFITELQHDPAEVAIDWLRDVWKVMDRACKALKGGDKKRLRKAENIRRKVEVTGQALRQCSDDWFLRSGPAALKFGKEQRPGFAAKPLTAKYHFPHYFLNGHATIAMSATVGDPGTFSEELGIPDYVFRSVPSRYPPEARQVHALDVPSMGRKATDKDFEHQADAIAKAILSCPRMWSGLIHVTRKREAKLLADRLARRGLGDRIWPMDGWDGVYVPTDGQVAAWDNRKKRVPGSLCITWSLWEGFDGTSEKINIVAKVPWPYLGDEYEKAKLHYSGRLYHQRTAWQLEQGLGRTRRGRDEDYDLSEVQGYVAIADGSWPRVKKYVSQALRESLTLD